MLRQRFKKKISTILRNTTPVFYWIPRGYRMKILSQF